MNITSTNLELLSQDLDLLSLENTELQQIDGGLFPIIFAGMIITSEAVAWAAAGGLFAAGAYVGYKSAGK